MLRAEVRELRALLLAALTQHAGNSVPHTGGDGIVGSGGGG
mgnify:CR=1 FL=1